MNKDFFRIQFCTQNIVWRACCECNAKAHVYLSQNKCLIELEYNVVNIKYEQTKLQNLNIRKLIKIMEVPFFVLVFYTKKCGLAYGTFYYYYYYYYYYYSLYYLRLQHFVPFQLFTTFQNFVPIFHTPKKHQSSCSRMGFIKYIPILHLPTFKYVKIDTNCSHVKIKIHTISLQMGWMDKFNLRYV